ncbi:MAG: ADP-ribosylglycohydrolase family protein [Bacillota bacterium]|nr:ADP-ribosylglycohydrolase family protein [Bacillota bacterium]
MKRDVLIDKIMGCWVGKNIGGVLGEPFECTRGLLDVKGYVQDLSAGPPANDDLDLQLVWLNAVERYGRQVNATILGEYWLSYIIPNWVEYGTGKANLRAGLVPPFSGYVDNIYRNSNGAWIRSELWACLCPGRPALAARYAYEDAIVDHAEEGVYGEVFMAAMQAAAFVESDREKLLDIGLSYIPADSKLAAAVTLVRSDWAEGRSFQDTWRRVHDLVPGSFGIQGRPLSVSAAEGHGLQPGAAGFDAPQNLAYAVMGWYHGRDDFGESLLAAVNAGEDTDCTAATLGALLGIISGASGIPAEWRDPLGDKIVTKCINLTSGGLWIPRTCAELGRRLFLNLPGWLGPEECGHDLDGTFFIRMPGPDELMAPPEKDYVPLINGSGFDKSVTVTEKLAAGWTTQWVEAVPFVAEIDYGEDGPFFYPFESKSIRISLRDNNSLRQQFWVEITVWTPEGVSCREGRRFRLPLNTNMGSRAEVTLNFVFDTSFNDCLADIMVDIGLVGRHTSCPVRLRLIRLSQRSLCRDLPSPIHPRIVIEDDQDECWW